MELSYKPYPLGGSYMDIKELQALDTAREQYKKTKVAADGDAYFQAIINVMDWLIAYAKDVFNGQKYDDEHLIPIVFVSEADIKKENAYKQYIRHCLYIASDYAESMKDKVLQRDHLDRYETLTYQIESDFEWLVARYECCFKGAKDVEVMHGSAPDLMPRQILFATNNLYYLEDVPQVEDLDFRNMKPYMMFHLRQLLELLGKNLIGYRNITDKSGRIVPKMTQVSWQFLYERSKAAMWSLKMPLSLNGVVRISKWANSFVHTTRIYSIYLQYYALTLTAKLMKMPGNGINTFFQRGHWNVNYGDFEVENYYWLKKDFEQYVWERGKNYVEWKPLDKVGAYLLSYGKPKMLFVMCLPPPVHGQSMVGKMIHDSRFINDNIDATYIKTSSSTGMDDMGKMRWGKIRDFLKVLKNVYKTVRKEKPQLVYVTPVSTGMAFYRDFVLMQMLKMLGCNVVAHFHNKGVSARQDHRLDNWLYRQYFKNINVILLAGNLFDDIKKYVKSSQVFVCPNGIKDEHPGNVPTRNNPIPQLLFLSNLLTEKGVVDLLDACKILNDNGVKFECTYVGAETSEITGDGFNGKVDERGLKGIVEYIGKRYGKEKEACYANSDIFVFPTYYHNECFPLVLLEAMSYGLPCVSTDEGAICEIIDDGKTGYVVEKNNPQQLADKLEVLINDAALRKTMGDAGKAKFEELYTVDKFEWNLFNILHYVG